MDQFHDGHHVRLRNLVQRTYLHAADDGVGVTLHERRASMNAAWAVHIYHGGDGDGDGDGQSLLLHSAAYGRYLAAAARPARLGHRGLRAELSDYDLPEVEAIVWRAVGSGFEDDVVLLRHLGGRYLRANGKYLPWNSSGVSVDDDASPMMYWVVEPIPFREAGMPAIPGPLPTRPRCLSAIFVPRGGRRLAPVLVQGEVRVPPEGRPGVPRRCRRGRPEHRHVRPSGPLRETDPARRRPAPWRLRRGRDPRDCRFPGRDTW
ncbi:unnamed protein product [Triticum aestivum]|uniref:DUF569 domain-containing protein n=2 Tax=Triticinae TaxID=1648030 RepID=A0A453AIM6_AEGTS|nr:unnamed protein product [Triticum aestivum]